MAARKEKKSNKKVKSLPAKTLSSKQAKGVKGGTNLKGKEKWIELS